MDILQDVQSNTKKDNLCYKRLKKRIKHLNEEDEMLYNEKHPQFLLELKKINDKYNEEMERFNIWKMTKLQSIEVAYNNDLVIIEKEYEARLNELIETLYNEAEEKKRAVENEINSMDVGSTSSNNSNYFYGYANKKTLRRFHLRQNVTVETVNYGKFPGIIQSICDKFVNFRSSMAGDTRQVTATKDDLEYGRVVVKKRY